MCDGSYRANARPESANRPDAEGRREAAVSLESTANSRGSTPDIRIRAKRCRCNFCSKCGPANGRAVERKLRLAVKGFVAVQMWTLTIAPWLFESPEEMLEYVSAKKCVAELMRTLRDQNLLLSDRYFYTIEFHKSGFIHFHLLLDAKFIKHSIVQERWDKFRPKDAVHTEGQRFGFGIVRFSPRDNQKFKRRPEVAVGYVTKYLTKHPKEGYPDWVHQSRKRIVRYRKSRDLFAPQIPEPKPAKLGEDPKSEVLEPGDGVTTCSGVETCFCPKCRRLDVLTIGEKVARCGQQSNAFNAYPIDDEAERLEFRGCLHVPFDALTTILGRSPSRGSHFITPGELDELEREYGSRDPLPEGMLPRDVQGTPSEPAYKHDERLQDSYAGERARAFWSERLTSTRSESPTEPTGGDPPLQAGGPPAGRQATLSCPLADEDECDGEASLESVGDALVHLRDVHGVTGDQAFAVVEEAIDDLGDDVSRHRWGRAVADALAGLLGDDADSRGKGEAA